MAIMVSNISLPFTAPAEEAVARALSTLGLSQAAAAATVAKRALDARRRGDIRFVYTVAVEAGEAEAALAAAANSPQVRLRREEALTIERGASPMEAPPVIAGFGPAGMFAGLLLARQGFRPVILERGGSLEDRVERVDRFWSTGELDTACNVQFGEGGAGTFSDGKLTTRIGDSRCDFVLQELVRHGAPGEILWQAKPHLGTDKLRGVVRSLREEIVSLGGQVRFGACVEAPVLQNGRLRGVRSRGEEIAAGALVLAVGHSARDTFGALRQEGIALCPKPFSVGVRIEHLQSEIDRALYGDLAGHPLLPPGEYQLSHRQGERAVYTFCMCPGGVVVPAASQEGSVVTNGMSWHARDGSNANAALVVSVDAADCGPDPLDGVAFQRGLEEAAFQAGGGGYRAPAQTVGRLLEGRGGVAHDRVRPSYALGVTEADLGSILPPQVNELLALGLRRFEGRLRGFSAPEALLTGVETRTSSPVRIPRDAALLEAEGVGGLYPCGEGAGYAGGIVSAAVDGVRVAQAICARYRPAPSANG